MLKIISKIIYFPTFFIELHKISIEYLKLERSKKCLAIFEQNDDILHPILIIIFFCL
jgi:hypothetical protein